MKRRGIAQSAFFNLRASAAILFCAGAACSVLSATLLAFFHQEASSKFSQRTLSFSERVAYQRAIEDVYWRHRIWPKERRDPKPSLDAVMSQAQIQTKVGDYLRDSQALEADWHRPITAEELQAEMDRMAQHTNQPEVLREVFTALGKDPFVIAECLARPVLAEGLLRKIHDSYQEPLDSRRGSRSAENQKKKPVAAVTGSYTLPIISTGPNGCVDDTWTATSTTNAPAGRYLHTAVWTGNEMIVWGGYDYVHNLYFNTGGRYNPTTDSWTATSITNAPSVRYAHTAVWTGSEMIVWGGFAGIGNYLNTGGRYDPSTDSWTATSRTNAPAGRAGHTAVWTGSEMIVWGGGNGTTYFNTGGRYNPSTDTWTATNIINAPAGREGHTPVWTGSEMIVWGGYYYDGSGHWLNTGGRYNPALDSWTATSTTNAPDGRVLHTAVWTGSEMIVWAGSNGSLFNTGGRYDPTADSWTATSTTNAPSGRAQHTAVWIGSQMIVWGGAELSGSTNTGGRYNPGTDSWTATSTTTAPVARNDHTVVWTGSEMIVWGGTHTSPPPDYFNTGGRYCAQSGSPTPTPTPTATATPRATPTSRVRPTPAPRP
jgi:N-acetylneuraminic acid mutarotase